jgi:hypothetical protein
MEEDETQQILLGTGTFAGNLRKVFLQGFFPRPHFPSG